MHTSKLVTDTCNMLRDQLCCFEQMHASSSSSSVCACNKKISEQYLAEMCAKDCPKILL